MSKKSSQPALFDAASFPPDPLPWEVAAENDRLVARLVFNRPVDTPFDYLVPKRLAQDAAETPPCRAGVKACSSCWRIRSRATSRPRFSGRPSWALRVGPLSAGLLAQFAPSPLVLPYVIFGGVLVVLALLIAFAPETAGRPDPQQAWRPQRVAIPAHARGTFFAAMGAAAAAFAVYGVFNSLMPGFLAGTMHETSYAVAGAVAFSAFAAGAVAQIALGTASIATTLKVSVPVLFAGLALFTVGMWLPSLPVFVIGGIVTGAGGGLVFRGSLAAAASTAPPESRAEALAGFFLGAYIGLSVPVIALGVATEYVAARDVMLVFVVLAAAAIAAGVRAVLRHHGERHR